MTPTSEQLDLMADALCDASRLGAEAVAVFGSEAQEDVAIEEAGEYIVALCHNWRERNTDDDVRSEIADVLITALQMAVIYGLDETVEAVRAKVSRLNERLKEARR